MHGSYSDYLHPVDCVNVFETKENQKDQVLLKLLYA